MPRPEFVNIRNFTVRTVVFEGGAFAGAWGEDGDRRKRLAMRWNGDDDRLGYPHRLGQKSAVVFSAARTDSAGRARFVGPSPVGWFCRRGTHQNRDAQASAPEKNLWSGG